ncbi:MAG: hypothetical protein R3D25_11395 [Geminicoccaceae bacterium]
MSWASPMNSASRFGRERGIGVRRCDAPPTSRPLHALAAAPRTRSSRKALSAGGEQPSSVASTPSSFCTRAKTA